MENPGATNKGEEGGGEKENKEHDARINKS